MVLIAVLGLLRVLGLPGGCGGTVVLLSFELTATENSVITHGRRGSSSFASCILAFSCLAGANSSIAGALEDHCLPAEGSYLSWGGLAWPPEISAAN